jgi:hypothetical protein
MIQVLDNIKAGEWIEEHKDDIFKLLEPVLSMYLKAPSNMVRRAMCDPHVFCVVANDSTHEWFIHFYDRNLLYARAGIGTPKAVISSNWSSHIADLMLYSGRVSGGSPSREAANKLCETLEVCMKTEREQDENTTNPE